MRTDVLLFICVVFRHIINSRTLIDDVVYFDNRRFDDVASLFTGVVYDNAGV